MTETAGETTETETTESFGTDSAKPRRRQGGEATSEVVVSAHLGRNADLFPDILRLHVPFGSTIADVTWGKGVFWKRVPDDWYELLASDLKTGTDCRNLPYDDASLDAVVLDPPYMEGLFRKSAQNLAGGGSHGAFRENYSNGAETTEGPKYHDAVLDLYYQAGAEARRVLKRGGVFIVKCQDEVSVNRQRLTHVELINHFEARGFYTKDLFVVVRTNRPGVSRVVTQVHARKNHSYFLVFQLVGEEKVKKAKSQPANREPPPSPVKSGRGGNTNGNGKGQLDLDELSSGAATD